MGINYEKWPGLFPSGAVGYQTGDTLEDYNRQLAQGNTYSLAQLGQMLQARMPQTRPQSLNYTPPGGVTDEFGNLVESFGHQFAKPGPATPTYANPAPMPAMPQAPPLTSINLMPTEGDVSKAIDLSGLVNDSIRAYYEKANPGSTANNNQATANIGNALAGRLDPIDEQRILRQGVEMGGNLVPGSPSAISGALVNYMGGVQALREKGEGMAASQFNRTPKPIDPTQFLTKPENKIALIVEQSRRDGQALHDNQETALRLELERMNQSGLTLNRDLQVRLEQMKQAGQIKHDATISAIAEADRIAGNWRTSVQTNADIYKANLQDAANRYNTDVQANTRYDLGNLRYANQGPRTYSPNAPNVPNYPDQGGGGGTLPGDGGWGDDNEPSGSNEPTGSITEWFAQLFPISGIR